jgi:NADH:ubiquinone oxidoreductase subunit 2 (subunit N)
LLGVLTTVIQTAYLLRIVNYMYAKEPANATELKEPRRLLIPIFVLVAIIIILGIYPSIVLNLIDPAIRQLPFIP